MHMPEVGKIGALFALSLIIETARSQPVTLGGPFQWFNMEPHLSTFHDQTDELSFHDIKTKVHRLKN